MALVFRYLHATAPENRTLRKSTAASRRLTEPGLRGVTHSRMRTTRLQPSAMISDYRATIMRTDHCHCNKLISVIAGRWCVANTF